MVLVRCGQAVVDWVVNCECGVDSFWTAGFIMLGLGVDV